MSTFELDDRIGGRLRGTLHVPGATPGDVVTVGANGALSPAPGGGSQPGAVRIRKFLVAFDSAGLYTGAGFPLFTTAAGEEILDTWFEGSVDWDSGVTPLMDLASAAELANGEGWWVANGSTPPTALNILAGSIQHYTDSSLVTNLTLAYTQAVGLSGAGALPRKYATATEIVAVSWDDDSTSESAPAPYGATAGQLDLYVVSSVPA